MNADRQSTPERMTTMTTHRTPSDPDDVGAAIRRNEHELFDAAFAKHRYSKRVPPEVTIQREILELVDTALSNLALVFADAELARATGFDRILAGDLRQIPVAARFDRLQYDLREVAQRVGSAAAAESDTA
jgi:hypothetical protein